MTTQMIVTESNQAKKGNLLLIGDLLIDTTWPVRATKLSPEAPVPVAQLSTQDAIERPGGAGLAASFGVKNFKDMNLIFYTATSLNRANWLRAKNIKTYCTIVDPKKVIYKTRYIDEESRYHLLRVDNDDIAGKSKLNREQFTSHFHRLIEEGLNGIVLLDYRKGIFDDKEMLTMLIDTAREHKIPVYVDSRTGNLQKFKGATYLKLNKKEYEAALDKVSWHDSPYNIIDQLEIDHLLITKGEQGAELWNRETPEHTDYRASLDPHPGAPDVTGCGDAFDISFCYYRFIDGLTSSESMEKAVNMATDYAHMPIEERLC